MADWISARLGDLPIAPTRDAFGNVVLVPARARPRVLITAHMDQVGYMVSRVFADRAHCLPVGEPWIEVSRRVSVRVLGAGHAPLDGELCSLGHEGGTLKLTHIDSVRIGDRVLFADALTHRDDGRICGPALDNRVGCLIALRAARELADEDGDVAFAWTVREETELAGFVHVARTLEPAAVIAVDVTYATVDGDETESSVTIGGGPTVTLLDGEMVAHDPLVREFDRAAEELGVSWQREVVRSGGSEASTAHRVLGIPALALLVPIERAHTDQETADLGDIASTVALLVAGVRELVGRGTP